VQGARSFPFPSFPFVFLSIRPVSRVSCSSSAPQWLNLSGLPALRSTHLAGLCPAAPGDPPPRLETLILNHTGIDDGAAPFLAACPELAWLEVAETKMTSECAGITFEL
jgi:hypothetical protein